MYSSLSIDQPATFGAAFVVVGLAALFVLWLAVPRLREQRLFRAAIVVLIALGLLAVLVAASNTVLRPVPPDHWTIGTCVKYAGPGIGEPDGAKTVEVVSCDDAGRTHLVIAVASDPSECLPDAGAVYDSPFDPEVACLARVYPVR